MILLQSETTPAAHLHGLPHPVPAVERPRCSTAPSDIAVLDSLLGDELAAGAALLRAATSRSTRWFDARDGKRLVLTWVDVERDALSGTLPNLIHVTVLEPRPASDGTWRERSSAYLQLDRRKRAAQQNVDIIDGSARDERGNLEWVAADEALRAELLNVLRDAAIDDAPPSDGGDDLLKTLRSRGRISL
jgi:hypothetical protein